MVYFKLSTQQNNGLLVMYTEVQCTSFTQIQTAMNFKENEWEKDIKKKD